MSAVHDDGHVVQGELTGPRTLLVGTAFAVTEVVHTLGAANPKPEICGCLLPDSGNRKFVVPRQFPVKVLGDFTKLKKTVEEFKVKQVLVCLPVSLADHVQRLGDVLSGMDVMWRVLTPLADQLAGRMAYLPNGTAVGVEQANLEIAVMVGDGKREKRGGAGRLGEIDPLELIDRKLRPLNEKAIKEAIAGRTVMITGAGGSIGSEISRIVSRFGPRKLVLVERAENSLFEIDREIGRGFSGMERAAVLHDISDAPRTMAMVGKYRPNLVFHTAAHKHVPMMEEHPADAVENNFFGSRSMADAADTHGVDRFVMISTDKAVNPSSIMGATKRLAELYIQHLNLRSETVFSMVRFGNVLGSACSVLPIWGKQLAQGHPVTVTDPQMTRYFMTIPEAAGLVLQSATMSGSVNGHCAGGEIFLLDMGKPVRILDLAERFVRSQGFTPGVDAKIEFTGIRPGEKLHEQLAYDSEDVIATSHKSLHILKTVPPSDRHIRKVVETFDRMRQVPRGVEGGHRWQKADRGMIVAALKMAIPEMVVSDAVLAAS